MSETAATGPNIASREEWLAARRDLLRKEKAITRELDALRAARRALPWVRIDKPYVFETSDGRKSLGDLFAGRSQLAIYHFMLTPGSGHVCPGCSFIADHIDAARQHFEQADLAFAAISRAPLAQIRSVQRRMGWTFVWGSSHDSDFNHDFGVSFTDAEIATGGAHYNFRASSRLNADLPGASIFARDGDGHVCHTYSTYARGLELLDGAFNWLDLAPKGRNEGEGIMSWVRLHDEYAARPASGKDACCH